MSSALESLIKSVRDKLHELRIDQVELAARMDMPKQQLSDILSARRDFRISTVDRLAEALNCSPAELLMTPQDRSKATQTRSAEGVSAQEKLSRLALSLTDVEAANLLELAQHVLVTRIGTSLGTEDTPKKKKSR
jgi:plasmid maintenance system antidote protein VapI